jgi:four helix bundle protein
MRLVSDIYHLTVSFPQPEKYGLVSQMRRSVVSVPSNIAEGWGQKTARHYVHHLRLARSSVFETETQVLISMHLGYVEHAVGEKILRDTDIESRMLMNLIKSIES